MPKLGTFCPLIKDECCQHKCAFYAVIRGVNPNTGQEVDDWACTIQWLPVLLIQNAQQVRQAAAATESHRNEAVNMHKEMVGVMATLHNAAVEQRERIAAGGSGARLIEGTS